MRKYITISAIIVIGAVLYMTNSKQKGENKLYTGTYHDPVAPELRLERDKYLNRINDLIIDRNFEEATLLCDTLERLCPQSPICFFTGGIISHKLKDSIQSRMRLIRAKEIYDSLIIEHNDHRDMMNNLFIIRALYGRDAAEAAFKRYLNSGLNELDSLMLKNYKSYVYTTENPLDLIYE